MSLDSSKYHNTRIELNQTNTNGFEIQHFLYLLTPGERCLEGDLVNTRENAAVNLRIIRWCENQVDFS